MTTVQQSQEVKDCLAKIDKQMVWWEDRFTQARGLNNKYYQALEHKRLQVATGKKLPSEI